MNERIKAGRKKRTDAAIRKVEAAKRAILDIFDYQGFLYLHERVILKQIDEALWFLKNEPEDKDKVISLAK